MGLGMAMGLRKNRKSVKAPDPPGAERPAEIHPRDLRALGELRELSFVAIDFETATARGDSACALAVSLVDGGRLSGGRTWLVRPPENEYLKFNMMIHGIRPEDTRDAPELPDVWKEAAELIGERPVVAHNAAFDFRVLRDSLGYHSVAWPTLNVFCSLVLARRTWPGMMSYSLPPLARSLEIPLDRHHDPQQDAVACAEIARRICATVGADALEAAADRMRVRPGTLGPDSWISCRARSSGTRLSGLEPANDDFDPEHPFHGRCVVFTGTLLSMTRREAAQLVVDAGGSCTNSVSGKTDYLVFGEQDFAKFTDGQKSSKTRRAEELLADGHHIEVISEHDFLAMVK